jgi:mono/diheme cytochrome c family protein
MRIFIATVAAALFAMVVLAATQQPDPPPGRAPYRRICAECHGANAEGNQGPKLAGITIDYDEFVAKVRHSDGEMPSISAKELSDDELKQVYAYLQGL